MTAGLDAAQVASRAAEVSVSPLFEVRTAPVDALLEGEPLARTELYGWWGFVFSGDAVLGLGEILWMGSTLAFTGFNPGQRAERAVAALVEAEERFADGRAWFLHLPQVLFTGLVVEHEGERTLMVVAGAPADGNAPTLLRERSQRRLDAGLRLEAERPTR